VCLFFGLSATAACGLVAVGAEPRRERASLLLLGSVKGALLSCPYPTDVVPPQHDIEVVLYVPPVVGNSDPQNLVGRHYWLTG